MFEAEALYFDFPHAQGSPLFTSPAVRPGTSGAPFPTYTSRSEKIQDASHILHGTFFQESGGGDECKGRASRSSEGAFPSEGGILVFSRKR